jgi:hypothetical protein
MDTSIGVNQDTLGRESQGAVAGDGVAMIEVAVLAGAEFDPAIAFEPTRDATIGCDGFNHGKAAIDDAKRLVWCGELNPVANREHP